MFARFLPGLWSIFLSMSETRLTSFALDFLSVLHSYIRPRFSHPFSSVSVIILTIGLAGGSLILYGDSYMQRRHHQKYSMETTKNKCEANNYIKLGLNEVFKPFEPYVFN